MAQTNSKQRTDNFENKSGSISMLRALKKEVEYQIVQLADRRLIRKRQTSNGMKNS